MLEIFNFFPINISNLLYQNSLNESQNLEEIRMRVRKAHYFKL